ncbi:uncharacterized protein LOC111135652 [Crassostrea virginica]
MQPQTEHTKDQDAVTNDPANGAHQGSIAGLRRFRYIDGHSLKWSTPRIMMQRLMTQPKEHTKDPLLDYAASDKLIMNFMRIPLDHSVAEGSSSGKSQLPEGAT